MRGLLQFGIADVLRLTAMLAITIATITAIRGPLPGDQLAIGSAIFVTGYVGLRMPMPQTKALGGVMRLASGGFAHGTDTIPAMLSPGEFVVNAASTREFYSQLVPMNAAPAYCSDGGSVDNSVTVGDINVHAARSPDVTARAVVDSIKRELRRGTRKL